MRAVILVAWRGGDEYRERAFDLVYEHYEPLGWPIYAADSDPAKPYFSLAEATNKAARLAGKWESAFIIAADCVIDRDAAIHGMDEAERSGDLVLPFRVFHRPHKRHRDAWWLNECPACDDAIAQRFRDGCLYLQNHNWAGHEIAAPAGAICIRRDLWDRMGGYDEKYDHWGPEDLDFLVRARENGADIIRHEGEMFHFWHASRDTEKQPEDDWEHVRLASRYDLASGRLR